MIDRFVWITDVHSTSVYGGGGTLNEAISFINGLQPSFVIDSGDLSNNGTVAELAHYVTNVKDALLVDLYTVPGNHDYYTSAGPANYNGAGLTDHFVVDHGNWRFVGVTATTAIPYDAFFEILQSELDYIDAAIATAGGRSIVIVSHAQPAIITTVPGGFADMVDWCNSRGLTRWWAGHDHSGCLEHTERGVQIIRGGSLYWNGTIQQANNYGGMMICNVFDARIEIDYRSARTPWQSWGAGDYPAYTPITVLAD